MQFDGVQTTSAETLPGWCPADHVLVLDNGTQVFVWIGRNVDAAAVAPKYTELINAISERRFPMPEVRVAAEGTGDARYIAARLVPAHRDSDTEQEAMMPSLKSLPSATREALRSNLLPSEEPSMLQWCRHYYVHPALDNSQQIFSSLAS